MLQRPIELAEYTAGLFRRACERLGVRQSMGRPGSALDNAAIESWHSTLQFELRSAGTFATRAAARARVAAWIREYNHDRRHTWLGDGQPGGLRAGPDGKGSGRRCGAMPGATRQARSPQPMSPRFQGNPGAPSGGRGGTVLKIETEPSEG